MNAANVSDLYKKHLSALDESLGRSLELAGQAGRRYKSVVFHAGSPIIYHRDDRPMPFWPCAHFRRWVPPLSTPENVVHARPGEKPQVYRVLAKDYWHDTSPPAPSYWEDAVELIEVESFDAVVAALGTLDGAAYVGPSAAAAQKLGLGDAVEPAELMAPLDWFRAYKTDFEIDRTTIACQKAAAGHIAARKSFKAWGTERQIHWKFLEASEQLEGELPYDTIVALDAKGAILHYQNKRNDTDPGKVLLMDAGAACDGYASDITRTWAMDDCENEFLAMLNAMDELEQDLVAMVTPGRPYLDIHLAAYRGVARILVETGAITTSVDEAVDSGLVSAFFPHGVGHHMGLHVHDAGGHQAGPDGGEVKPPAEHPFLRNTRVLEAGHLITIEPGLYFIPMLLAPHREGENAGRVDWDLIDRLTPHGGIRIEDNIVCTDGEPVDLTRPLVPGPRGE